MYRRAGFAISCLYKCVCFCKCVSVCVCWKSVTQQSYWRYLVHSPGYRESCLLRLAFSPLGHLSGHPAGVWPALRGCSAFPAQSQTMVAASLGAECLRDAAGPGGGAAGSLFPAPSLWPPAARPELWAASPPRLWSVGTPPPTLPLCYTSNQRFHLERGLHRCCRCQRPRCWLPEQDCSCPPGIFVLD